MFFSKPYYPSGFNNPFNKDVSNMNGRNMPLINPSSNVNPMSLMRKLYVSALLLLTGLCAVQAQNLVTTYENSVSLHNSYAKNNAFPNGYALLATGNDESQPESSSIANAYYWTIIGNTIAADQTICYNTTPAALTGSLPTGGNGTFTYQWQQSTTSATAGFANIGGATAQGYAPAALTANRWYKRIVTSGAEKDTSAVVQITVTPVINGAFNVISAAQTICYNTAPALLTGTAPAGGNGTYTYQWQSSPDNATWTNISSATNDTYAAPVLTTSVYYRRIVYSGNCSHTSASIKVTVTPVLATNSFTQEQSVCSGQTPVAFTGSTPTGGNGTYTYLWQSSTTSSSNGFATAAGTTNGKNYSAAALTQTTWFRRVVSSGGCTDTSAAVVITVFNAAPGDPTVYGNGNWNVYAYSDNSFTTYAGYYTEPSLSFLTSDRYTIAQSPSYASGYQGCMVPVTNFSASMKRTNFTPGIYQLDLSALDDNVYLLINGVQVYTRTCCIVPPTVTSNIWTGTLGASDQVEIKWVQLTSTSRLGINFSIVTPTPLVPGGITNSQSVCYGEAPASGFTSTSAASGGCTYTGYQWQSSIDSITWVNIAGATALTYTETAALTQTKWYRRVISDACYNVAPTVPVKITVNVIPPGDTSVYGDNTWNVYEYQYLPANNNFSAATYKGYYTEPSLSFNSTSRWANGASPSLASGYQGCYVAPTYHWMSYKRTDFSPATYQIDIPAHDDNVYVYLNGLLIFSHAGCCDSHTNIWTGPLGATDQIEMRVMQGGGGAYGSITLTPVTPLPLTAGSITPSQTICAGNVPPNPLVQATAPTNGCTIKNYGWELSTDNGASWTTVSGATASSYTIPGSIYTQTLYRRIVYDVCGNSAATVPDTIYMNGSAPGDPTVFGNGTWNVYCFQDVNYSIYSGYYTEPSLTFATTSRYPSTSPPSIASGYQGCQLINNYYSVSMKRTGFAAGTYQIDVTADDDYTSIYINGALVSSLTYPTIQNNVWTGNLSPTDQIEVRWRNNAGPGQTGVRFTLVSTTPLDPGTISANNPSVCAADVPIISSVTAASGACYVNYSWEYSTDGGTTWNVVSGATSASYTASTALTVNTQFRRVATDVCGSVARTAPVSFTVGAGPQGDPTVFGNGAWNVYAYNANGTAFSTAVYMGYYTEPLLSFSSLNRWPSIGAPSQASGYLGCQVDADNHWVSYRRTNITPGTYQLDITSHDDPVWVYINGVLVFTHATCCDTHTNIWTGNITASDKVEFLWREYNGGSNGGMNFTLVTPSTSVTGGTVSASQTICNNTIPAAFANVDSAVSGCYVYYQWQYQSNCTGAWTDITGATGAAYTPTAALTVPTCYRRAAINACGNTAYSNTITVSIYSTTLTAGTIASNQTICKGATAATLTSTALPTGGDGNYVYQWQSSADNVGWTNITGATALTYAPGAITTTTYFRRNVTACSGNSSASSASVLITVNQPPVITVQPANAVACTGNNTSITVTATGTSLTYQWQVNTGSSWANVTNSAVYSGATSATLNITGVTAGMNGYTYRVLINGSCTPALTSNVVTLTTGTAPSISSQPVNTTTCVGSNAVFSVTASGSGLTYQWQQRPGSGAYSNISDGGVYSGTNTSTLTLTGVTATMNNYSYQCIVTSSCAGTVTTSVAVLTVVAAITNNITADQSVCTGMTATTLTGNNSGAYTYLWQSSTVSSSAGFVNASGTNNAYNYNPNPISTTTWYRRQVTNTGCSAYSNVVNIVVNSTPLAITAQPVAQTICAGDVANYTVGASGPGTLTYQWYEYNGSTWTAITNGGIYSGATNATLTLTGATTAMNGYRYYARVFASGCTVNSVNSNNALLTTNSAPVVTTNPADQTSCAGNNVAIGMTATGLNLTYQWQQNTGSGWSNLANYGIYADVNTNTLRIYGVTTAISGSQYRCVVTGTCAPYNTTSGVSTLTINPAIANNSISNSQNLCAGTPVPFTGSTPTGGDGTYTYQWMQNTGSGWTNISGATGINYASGALTQTTQFIRNVSSGSACASNNSIAITVTINPSTTTTDPKDTTVCAGNTVTFGVTASGTGLGYQWQAKSPSGSFANISNGVQYTGVNTATLSVITPAYALNGYQYRCIVSGNCSPPSVTSNPATLTLNPIATITTQPSNVFSCEGSTVSFSVVATGPGLVYQWREKIASGVFANITDGGIYGGSNTATLTLTGITAAMNTNQYMCVITAGSCPVNSNNASLTVNQQPSLMITNPATVCAPATVNITAAAVTAGSNLAGGTLTYWTNSTATTALSNPSAIAVSGTYYIRVATSPVCYDIKPVIVTINPSLTNNTVSAAQTICTGTAPTAFTGTTPTGGNGVYTYQWQSSADNASWSDISGATSIGYSAGVLTTTTWYRRVVNSNVCTGISASIKVTVDAMPVAAISYAGTPFCATGTASVTQTGQGGGTYSSTAGLSINASTGAINLASSTPGTYTITYNFSSGACSNSTSTTITINALPTVVVTNPAAVCSPNTVDITTAAVTAGSTSGLTYTYFTDAAATTTLTNANAVATSGTYYIKGTAATGCFTVKPVVVTINPLPTANISYAGTPFCATGTANVTQTGQGGGTYTSTAGLSINTSTGAINLAASTAGTYTVTYNFTNGTCSNTTTTSVTINALPTVTITNPAAVCAPNTVDITVAAITAGSTSGLTYTYFTDAAATTTLTNPNAIATSGTYYIKGTTAAGCFTIKPVVVTINPLPTAIINYAGTPFCATGTANVTQTGQGGGTYSSTAGLSINASTGAINLATSTAGTYTVTYSFTNGTCSNTTTTSVTINALPTVVITNPAAVCAPNTVDITAAAVTTGSTSGLTYTYFTDAAATTALTNANAVSTSGTYYIKGTTAAGCFTVKPVVVTINPLPTATINYAGTPFCATGTASVTQTGQAGGTYSSTVGLSINASTGAINLTASTAGIYTITYSFTNGTCGNTTTTSVTINALPTVTITNPAAVCAPNTVDITTAAVTAGSTSGLTYTYFTDAAATTTLSNANAVATSGTYYIKGTTAAGCFTVKPVVVTINPLPTVTITNPAAVCAPNTVDITTAAVTAGSTSGLTYTYFTDAAATTTLTNPNAVATSGTYYIKGTTAAGCFTVKPVVVTINPLPTASISYAGTPFCATGTANVTQTGQAGGTYISTAGLSINTSTGAINLAASTAGTYTVTYSFTNGTCSNTTTTSVTINALPTVVITNPAAVCAPNTVDIIAAAVTAGSTSGLTYTYFTDAAATTTLTNANAVATSGTYYIKGTTAAGCFTIKPVVVTINPLPTANISYAGTPFCATGTTASVTQTGQGGGTYTSTAGLSINATTGAIDLASSTAGTYTVTYSFTNGTCSNTTTTSVTINALPTVVITNPATVCAPNTVDITVAAITAGSTSGLTYTYFTDAAATTTLTNANAVAASGTYYIKGTTAAGCFTVKPVVVTINPLPTATINYAGTPFCATGTASVTQTGQGGGTYTSTAGLSINSGTGAINLTASTAGTYTVTYSFTNGTCSNTTTTSVTINALPTVVITNPAAVCAPNTVDITVTAITAGSTSGLTYTYFTDAAATTTLTNPNAVAISGTYYIKGTTAAGCFVVKPVVVTINPLPTASISYAGTPFCATGTATVTQTGQTGGTYSSTAGLSINTSTGAINLAASTAGTYTVTYSFTNGICSNTTTTSVTINALPTVTITNPAAVCAPNTVDITAAAVTAGSTSGLTYTYFTDAAATTTLANANAVAASGTYYIKGTAATGCFTIKPVVVTINPLPTASISYAGTPFCSTGTVSVIQTGQGGGTYSSTAGLSINTSTGAINLAASTAGTYTVTYSFTNGTCSNTTTTSVTINALPTVTITNPAAVCAPNTVDITAAAITAGSTSGLTYTYFTDAAATTTLTNPNAVATSGTYYIKGTTAAGCFTVKPVVVTINPLPTVTITNPAAVCAPNTVDITVAAITAGSTSGLTYTYFTDAAATTTLTNANAVATSGTYYIKGTAATGCFTVKPVVVTINPLPTATINYAGTPFCATGTASVTQTGQTSGTYSSTAGLSINVSTGAINLAASTAGTYTVTYSFTNGTCSNTTTTSVTINALPTVTITNPAAVCAPNTVDITATAITAGSTSGLTYTYFTDAAATTTLTNPNAVATSGTYYIKGTTAAGCFTIKPVVVTVNPLPTVTITNPAAVCTPNTVDITVAAVTAGSTSGLTYTYFTDAAATTTLTNANAVATSGTYYIKGTAATGCFTIKPVVVTINPLPTATINYAGTPFCATGTANVTQTGQAGGTYSSTAGLSINATTGAIDLASSTAGTYTVTYSFTNGTCSNTTTTSVTINALPTVVVTNPAAVCAPNTVDITAASVTAGSTSGLTYTYFTDAAATTTLSNPNAVATSGTYYIKGTTATGCFTIKPVVVTINPLPTANINYAGTPFCATGTVSVTQTGQAGGTYSSTAGLSINASTGAINLAASTAGTYTVTYSFTNGTCSNTTTTSVTINALPTVTITNPAAVCAPNTVDITVAAITAGSTSGLTYTYFTDAAATTTLSNANAVATSGAYYIKGTTAAGCFTIKPVVVTINPLPTVVITNPAAVCAPNTVDITTAAVTAGSTSGLTYTYFTDAAATTTLSNANAVATSGTYYIKGTTAAGCFTVKPVVVTINPLPTASVSYTGTPFCATGTASVTQTGQGGGTYTSTAGLSIDATTGAIDLASSTAGTYTITYSFTNGTCSNTTTTSVTINALPTVVITNPAAVCAPNTVDITVAAVTAGSTSGLTYTYFTDAAATTALTNPNAIASSGTYYIMGTTAAGCSTIKPVVVTVNPLPTASISYTGTPFCATGTANVTQTGQGGGTYTSTAGLSINATTGAIDLASSTAGTYTVTYSFTNGTCSNTTTTSVTINALPIVVITNPAAVCSPGTVDITDAAITAGSTSGLTYTYFTDAAATTTLINANAVATSGTYYIKGTTATGCFTIKPVVVTINPLPTVVITNPAAVCAPNTVDITVAAVTAGSTSGLTYTYFTDAAATTTLTNANVVATSGTYYIKGTAATGCFTIKPVVVTINPLPTATINYAGTPFCATGTASVTQTGQGGGTYSSTAGLSINATTGAIDLASSTAGTYTVTYSFTNGTCGNTTTTSVTINALPTVVITNPAAVCAPNTVDITDAAITAGSTSGLTYTYFTDAAATTTLTNPNAVATSGTYYIKGTTAAGCFTIKPVVVTINPLPTVTITNPAAVCSPNTVDITTAAVTAGSTSGLTYTYFTDAAATTALTNPNAIASSGTYYIKGNTAAGCSTIKPVVVTVNPLPTASINYTGSPYCATGTANVTQTGQAGGTYTSTTGLSINASTGAINLAASTAGTYTVTYTFSDGNCSNTTTASVVINPMPTATIAYTGSPYCASGSATVTRTGLFGGTYTSAAGLSLDATTGDVNLATSTPGSYVVFYNYSNGLCSNVATTTIVINTPPTISVTNPPAVCAPTKVNLTLSSVVTGTGTGISFAYYSDAAGLYSVPNPTAVGTPGVYYVKAVDVSHCESALMPILVNIIPQPGISTSGNAIICLGNSTTISASSPGSTLMWQTLGSNSSYTVAPTTTTDYTVTATNASGCQTSSTLKITVEDFSATLESNPDPVLSGTSVLLKAGGNTNFSVLAWTPTAVFTNQTAITQSFIIQDTTLYSVVVKSQAGCIDTAYLKVMPEPNTQDFFMPNAFTPNGDGKNDIFKAYGLSIKELELRVFNQWGQLLFETKNPSAGWNGYYKGGIQPAGPYVYTVKVMLYSGKTFSKKGTFSLIR